MIVLGGQRRCRARDDEGGDQLAPLLVGDADDGDLGDRRVWKISASSTSIDETFSPPEMITSFLRSEIVT